MWVCHGLSPNGAWPPISDHFHAEHDEILLILVSVFWVPNSWDVWIWGWIKTRDFPCECEDEHQQQPAVLVNGAVLTHANLQHVYIYIHIQLHSCVEAMSTLIEMYIDIYVYMCVYYVPGVTITCGEVNMQQPRHIIILWNSFTIEPNIGYLSLLAFKIYL